MVVRALFAPAAMTLGLAESLRMMARLEGPNGENSSAFFLLQVGKIAKLKTKLRIKNNLIFDVFIVLILLGR
jgi:hypothetical protein